VLLAVLAGHLAAGRVARGWWSPQRLAERQAREGWRQLGVYLREQGVRSMVLVPLFPASHLTYGRRLAVLAEEARDGGAATAVFWAVEDGLYDGETGLDHGAVLLRVRERWPASELMVIVSAGELPAMAPAGRPRELGGFGGRLIVVGEMSGHSAWIDQARRGAVTLIVRRTGWLNDRLPSGLRVGRCLAGEFLVVGS
jgi:hypothetical protein